MNVLELGCGTGRVIYSLSKKVKRIVGIDVSDVMISEAKRKLDKENISFILDDIASFELDNKFNFIIAPFRVLQALETDKKNTRSFIKNQKAP